MLPSIYYELNGQHTIIVGVCARCICFCSSPTKWQTVRCDMEANRMKVVFWWVYMRVHFRWRARSSFAQVNNGVDIFIDSRPRGSHRRHDRRWYMKCWFILRENQRRKLLCHCHFRPWAADNWDELVEWKKNNKRNVWIGMMAIMRLWTI